MRRHAREVERQTKEVTQRSLPMAVLPVASRRSNTPAADWSEKTAAKTAYKIDILHQGQRRKAADRVIKAPRDQQALIAVRQNEDPAAPSDEPLHSPRPGCGVVQ